METFKKLGGEVVNVRDYVRDYVSKNPEVELFIGSDSQQKGAWTKYATVIVFYHPGKGAHFIFERYKEKRNKDLFSRLWNELEFSRNKAEMVYKELGLNKKSDITIDIDVNPNKIHKSNIIYSTAMGYLKGNGFTVRCKPDSWAASCAADLLCR